MGAIPPTGLFASIRQLLATALEIGQVRLALLGTELEEEKLRIFRALVFCALGVALLIIGAVLLCGWVLLLLGEGYRLAALGVLTLGFTATGLLLLRSARAGLRSPEGAFAATRAELARDRAALVPSAAVAPHDR